jgi:LL-diaminopimelate aminotransferase
MPSPSKKLGLLPPYLFVEIDRKVAEARAKGVDIISLGVGDPDLATPEPIVKALQEAVADKQTHNYPSNQGNAEFLTAVEGWMTNRFGVSVNAKNGEVLSLIGSKEGLAHMILAYVEAGDVVLCPSPGYPVYNNYTLLVGGEPYTVPLLPEHGFLPDLDAIPEAIARRAKLLFLNYPNNPTGALAPVAFIEKCVAFCKQYDIVLCHDNAYSEMTYDGYQAPSFLSVDGAKDVCVEFFSLSKMYNMTGWRVGFAVGNASLIKPLATVKNNTDSGVFKAVQKAAAVGLNHSKQLTAHVSDTYGRRRALFVKGLRELGWDLPLPEATFYLWAPVPQGMTSVEFVTLLLEQCGIVVPPGNGYGTYGEGYFRVALTETDERLTEALDRMKQAGIGYNMALAQA